MPRKYKVLKGMAPSSSLCSLSWKGFGDILVMGASHDKNSSYLVHSGMLVNSLDEVYYGDYLEELLLCDQFCPLSRQIAFRINLKNPFKVQQ